MKIGFWFILIDVAEFVFQLARDIVSVRMPNVIWVIPLPTPEDDVGAGDKTPTNSALGSGRRVVLESGVNCRIFRGAVGRRKW